MTTKLSLRAILVDDAETTESISRTLESWEHQIPDSHPCREDFEFMLLRAQTIFNQHTQQPIQPVVAAYDEEHRRLQGIGWFHPGEEDQITHVHGLITAPHNLFETPPMTRGVGTCLLAQITLLYPHNRLQLRPLRKEIYSSLGFQPGPTVDQMTLPLSAFPALQDRAAQQLVPKSPR